MVRVGLGGIRDGGILGCRAEKRKGLLASSLRPNITGSRRAVRGTYFESMLEDAKDLRTAEPSRRVNVEETGEDEEEFAGETSSLEGGDDRRCWNEAVDKHFVKFMAALRKGKVEKRDRPGISLDLFLQLCIASNRTFRQFLRTRPLQDTVDFEGKSLLSKSSI
jgi:hypothetical protein